MPDATGGAAGLTTGRTPGGVGPNKTRRRAGAPSELRAMNARMRSSVSVVMRPPLRKRLASLPSFTARRPKVDSARPRARQNSLISWSICSFMAALPQLALCGRLNGANQLQPLASTLNMMLGKMGKVGGRAAHRCNRLDYTGFDGNVYLSDQDGT